MDLPAMFTNFLMTLLWLDSSVGGMSTQQWWTPLLRGASRIICSSMWQRPRNWLGTENQRPPVSGGQCGHSEIPCSTQLTINWTKLKTPLQSTRSARVVCIFWDSWDLTSVGQYSGLSSPLWPVPSSMQLHVGAGGWGSWMPRDSIKWCARPVRWWGWSSLKVV